MDALIARLQDKHLFVDQEHAYNADDLAQELIALQSIYGENNIELKSTANVHEPITFQVQLECTDIAGDEHIKLQVQLPKGYPNCDEAPAMELVNRTVGPHHVDEPIRHDITSMFGPSGSMPWARGEPVLFQGIDAAYEKLRNWVDERAHSAPYKPNPVSQAPSAAGAALPPVQRQVDLQSLVHSDPIAERKSEFLGHAARITHPDDVRPQSN